MRREVRTGLRFLILMSVAPAFVIFLTARSKATSPVTFLICRLIRRIATPSVGRTSTIYPTVATLINQGYTAKNMETIVVNVSGVSLGNPGPAGVGVVIVKSSGVLIQEFNEAIGNAYADFAAYYAVSLAMQSLLSLYGDKTKKLKFEFRLDDKLVRDQLANELEITSPALVPYFIQVHNYIVNHFPHCGFYLSKRGKESKAEALAREAISL